VNRNFWLTWRNFPAILWKTHNKREVRKKKRRFSRYAWTGTDC